MCDEIIIADILQAAAKRKVAYKHYEAARASKEDQDFYSIETYIRPPIYDLDFDRIRLSRCEGTGTWLQQDTRFEQWLQDREESPQLCGPLVEVKDKWLLFVHFTVKEYLLRRQHDSLLSEGEALLDISATCLTYLSSRMFDLDATDDTVQTNLISGAYRLLNFASSQWAECLRLCVRHFRTESPTELLELLQQFHARSTNSEYDWGMDTNSTYWALQPLKDLPEACDLVSRALDFRRSLRGSYDWLSDEGSVLRRLSETREG
ncbi:hypothetical protein CEP52_016003 [Fusarium oligoseptatum]|uniref:Uncharacterized protein n=1 Tax=Fusarium oligoseptatum TaxID=2604345 RepID=A0A428S7Q3_9HYPO|nr:hypothetical protein CEP52_016003 [Fusarium oligoseptatum]